MLNHARDIQLLRQIDCELTLQYEEVLCLRAEVARLLFPLKISPPRKQRSTCTNRSAARVVKHGRQASCAPVLLLMPERPPTP
jgi:hypothetical protein